MLKSRNALDYLCDEIENGSLPAALSAAKANEIMSAFDEGGAMTLDEMLIRIGLKEPN